MKKYKEDNLNPIISDVKELAAYIKNSYRKVCKNSEISPLKLQKSLYFLFAYWEGFVRKGHNNPKLAEKDVSSYSEYLYNANIEAWVYGPVLPEVYGYKDIDDLNYENIFASSSDAEEFVEDLLPQIFKVSDFRLVDISHADKVWKKYFNANDRKHSSSMSPKEIIEEYANKV
ncbi:MAG: hypothetical protein LE178_02255 [Endomicrobium sp.]|nr:hypothetical protein [Endomicrobium sp.]